MSTLMMRDKKQKRWATFEQIMHPCVDGKFTGTLVYTEVNFIQKYLIKELISKCHALCILPEF